MMCCQMLSLCYNVYKSRELLLCCVQVGPCTYLQILIWSNPTVIVPCQLVKTDGPDVASPICYSVAGMLHFSVSRVYLDSCMMCSWAAYESAKISNSASGELLTIIINYQWNQHFV